MESRPFEQIRQSVLQKRDSLKEWLGATPPSTRQIRLGPASDETVLEHLAVLDKTADSASSGTLGICTVCNEHIETELLEMDYTTSVCLDHLSAEELRTLEAELQLAQTVQRSLLPQQVPDTPYLEIAAFSRPAQIIGGDYFDFFRFGDDSEGLAIADVAGHGVSASLHMASIHALLHTLVPGSASPSEVLERVQRLFIHNVHFSTFVTIFLGSYNPRTRSFVYCNAGHNPPMVLRERDGGGTSLIWLRPTSAAIGLVEETTFEMGTIDLEPGDLMVFYTDGVTEARNRHGEMFGTGMLEALVRRDTGGSAKTLVHGIRQELEHFVAGQSLADDTTIVVCRITR
jgi:sigma-B regulation protein RsbU (phosphoserine phosphatase)